MNQESLIRYIAGNATAEEKSNMAEWLDADPENMREFLAFRKLYDITLWQQENTDVQITNPSGSKERYKFRMLVFEALKVAAIVAVAFLLLEHFYMTVGIVDKVVVKFAGAVLNVGRLGS